MKSGLDLQEAAPLVGDVIGSHKPDSCPTCGSSEISKIEYGLSQDPLRSDLDEKTEFRGCVVDLDACWICEQCRTDIPFPDISDELYIRLRYLGSSDNKYRFLKVQNGDRLFVGRTKQLTNPATKYETIKIFNPVFCTEYRCAAMHAQEISESELVELLKRDIKTHVEDIRKELADYGISLDPALGHHAAVKMLQKERTRSLHRDFLKKSGVQNYPGSRLPNESSSGGQRRTSHCYSCKAKVDNEIDLECVACNWIVCGCCGACGCSYTL